MPYISEWSEYAYVQNKKNLYFANQLSKLNFNYTAVILCTEIFETRSYILAYIR